MPYLGSNICLVIAVIISTDTCGGIPFLKIAGEGDNHYLDHDIVNHVSCGWNWQMVEEHQNEYCQVKSTWKRQAQCNGKLATFSLLLILLLFFNYIMLLF